MQDIQSLKSESDLTKNSIFHLSIP